MDISFSIVVPFKKGKIYLQKCINSILTQSYLNYNIIVLADRTSNEDGSIDWLKQLSNGRIRVEQSPDVLDICQNWSRILDIDKAEYFTILGYDDVLYSDYLETVAELINQHPEASLFQTQFDRIDENDKPLTPAPTMAPFLSGICFLEKILKNQYSITATGYMISSRDYAAVKGMPVSYPNLLYADFELWTRLSFLRHQVVSPKRCFAFRIHQSTTKTSSEVLVLKAFECFINYLHQLMEERDCQKIIRAHLPAFLLYHCNFIAYRLIRKDPKWRDALTVDEVIIAFEKFAVKFGLHEKFYLGNINLKLARWVDSTTITKKGYILLKKFIPRPVIQ